MGSLPLQMHTLASRQQDTRPEAERDEALKQSSDLRRRHCQFQHELKRREQEYERLQASRYCRHFRGLPSSMRAGSLV